MDSPYAIRLENPLQSGPNFSCNGAKATASSLRRQNEPDRGMSASRVVDEHDFHCGQYLVDGQPKLIRIQAVLIELSEEALLRFSKHLRRWDSKKGDFADLEGGPVAG